MRTFAQVSVVIGAAAFVLFLASVSANSLPENGTELAEHLRLAFHKRNSTVSRATVGGDHHGHEVDNIHHLNLEHGAETDDHKHPCPHGHHGHGGGDGKCPPHEKVIAVERRRRQSDGGTSNDGSDGDPNIDDEESADFGDDDSGMDDPFLDTSGVTQDRPDDPPLDV